MADSAIPSDPASSPDPQPGPLNYILGFTLVGIAWGLTTPFIRRAARDHHPPAHPILDSDAVRASWLRSKVYGAFFAVIDLLRNPRYAVPLLLNLTGSVWFFLLIGKAGEFTYKAAQAFRPPPNPSSVHSVLLGGPCYGAHGRQVSRMGDRGSWMLTFCRRVELDRAHRQHAGVLVHGPGRLVGRWESHQSE